MQDRYDEEKIALGRLPGTRAEWREPTVGTWPTRRILEREGKSPPLPDEEKPVTTGRGAFDRLRARPSLFLAIALIFALSTFSVMISYEVVGINRLLALSLTMSGGVMTLLFVVLFCIRYATSNW